jgi:replicative DNA helicase
VKGKHGLSLVLVDYLQLMQAPQAERREQEVAQLSRGLKEFARILDVPVVALCQLNRDLEKRKDKRPHLSDLRESGALEQDAHQVLLLHRDSLYDASASEEAAVVIVAKNRNGMRGEVALRFVPERFRFEDPSVPEEAA